MAPLLAATLILAAGPGAGELRAQEVGGTSQEGALFLLLPVGPKAVSLGRAVTALPGAESVWWNPAGLGELEQSEILFFRTENLGGETTAATLVLSRAGLGSLGMAYELMDLGDQEFTDPDGNTLGTLSFRNHQGVVSLASRFWDRLSVGVNLKLIQTRFACRGQCNDAGVTATTFAVDAGVQTDRVADLPLRLAAALVHAGPDIQFENEEQADPLPTRLRIAAAYEVLGHWMTSDLLSLWVSAEVDDRWRDWGDPATYVGAELSAGGSQFVALRAGYVLNSDSQVDGAAVGMGVRYESFDLGIAKSLAQSSLAGATEPVHVSFGFVF